MNLARKDKPPMSEYYVDGTFVNILFCDKCQLHGRNGDLNCTEPCPRCGNELSDAVARWERNPSLPKWKFWRNEGRWVVKGKENEGGML